MHEWNGCFELTVSDAERLADRGGESTRVAARNQDEGAKWRKRKDKDRGLKRFLAIANALW